VNPAHIAAAALIGAAGLGLVTPAAAAEVDPDPMVAGQRVRISDEQECGTVHGARAASKLFRPVTLRPGTDGLTGDARVADGATPGRYRVTIECTPGGERFTELVTVRAGRVEGLTATQAAGGLALLLLAGGAAYLLRRSVRR
jgi:hypothetical protein